MTWPVHSNTGWTKSIFWLSYCIYFACLRALRLVHCPVVLLNISFIFSVCTSYLCNVIYYVYVIINCLVSRFWVVHLILIVWLCCRTMCEKILLASFRVRVYWRLSICNVSLERSTTILILLSRRCDFNNSFVNRWNHCVRFASLI